MNLPNKLTILRAIMIPFFLVFLYMSPGWSKWVALGIFIAASLTDMLDGKIARKYNLVTNFGKFMDPLADKLLVCSALIALSDLNRIPAWIVFDRLLYILIFCFSVCIKPENRRFFLFFLPEPVSFF